MGKGKRKAQERRAAAAEREHGMDDALSTTTSSSWGDSGDEDGAGSLDEHGEGLHAGLMDLVYALQEKKSTQRAQVLGSLEEMLQNNVMGDALDNGLETLVHSVMGRLRQKKLKEAVPAAAVLALVFIQAGSEADYLFEEVSTLLERVARDTACASGIRAAVLHALGTIAFISSEPGDETAAVIDVMQDVILQAAGKTTGSLGILTAAVQSWCLLVSRQPAAAKRSASTEVAGVVQEWLFNDEVESAVQYTMAAALGLLYEVLAKEVDGYFDLYAVMDRCQHLATESSKSKARKALKEQRAQFRALLDMLESGTAPEESLSWQQTELHISTWSEAMQLGAFRRCLGKGLMVHFQGNPLLPEIFNLEQSSDGFESQAAKRGQARQRAAQKKSRNQQRQKGRSDKATRYVEED